MHTDQIIKRDPNGKCWFEDFDIDLFKVVPNAKNILEEFGQTPLLTRGHVSAGRLNHPSCWNHPQGMVAFFSRSGDPTPTGFYSSDPIVECTFEEAIRDAWVHNLVIILRDPWFPATRIWDAFSLRRAFEALLYHIRGWHKDERAARDAILMTEISLVNAVSLFGRLVT